MNSKKLRGKVVALFSVLTLCLFVTAVLLIREYRLDQRQDSALAELESSLGQYDEQSIVLNNTSKAKAEALAELFGAELRITKDGSFAALTLPAGTTILDIYAREDARKYIDDMAADYHVSVSEVIEDETGDAGRQPSRPNYAVSDTDYELQTYLDYLNMSNVWTTATGSGITVAVIDTGIDTDHPEFTGRISEYSYNATEDKIVKDYLLNDGTYDWSLVEDEQGHGTAVTGVIAASMNSGDIVGIAPNVEILVIKAECDARGIFKRTSDLVFGLYYAIERDVQVVNMSFGSSGAGAFTDAVQLAYDSDVICVAAAGNSASSALCWPAADENVIGVGSFGAEWELASYSNYGENTDLVAPGTVYTTLMGGGYGSKTGTSLSAPIVTGAIALYMQLDKYATFDEVAEVLYASCYDLGQLGRDWDYGFGALDISALILEERGTITYDMLTDELENEEGIFIQGHALQELPEPERLYAVFDGWYYDDTFMQPYNYYQDAFYDDITLYAKWVNEEDGVPYTYVILPDGTVEIRSYTGHRRYIAIPEMIDGRVVSSVGDYAFSGQSEIREVTLPSGLTRIGRYAFEKCSNLISIQIPAGVKTIGSYAFSNATRLSSATFEESSQLQSIGAFAFKHCGKLTELELPKTLTGIDGSALYGTTSLRSITVQPGNTSFISKNGVLFNYTGTTLIAFPAGSSAEYEIPEGTVSVGGYAFAFAGLRQVDLTGVQSIGESAFAGAKLEAIVVPDSVTTMRQSVFDGCAYLSAVEWGRGLNKIPAGVFANCDSLTEIVIPNTVLEIGEGAFAGAALQTIEFEENSHLERIGSWAFSGCNLSEINIPVSVVEIGNYAFSDNFVGNPLVEVTFPEGSALKIIGNGAFAKCKQLKKVELPDGLIKIGDFAFEDSSIGQEQELTVVIPASVTTLGANPFAACSSLRWIRIAEGNRNYCDVDGVVYSVDGSVIIAYPSGKYETEYTVQSGARRVESYAFAGAHNLRSASLPDSMEELAEYAFYDAGLLQMHIPDNVVQIGRYAFSECKRMTTVTFNETSRLPRIGYRAFANCGLTSFRVPANVSTIAQEAFCGCVNLKQMTFARNSKLSSISAYLFTGCGLESIVFEEGSALTSIQAHGFDGMAKLTTIDFGDAKLENVDNFAFRFCVSLPELSLPDTVVNIGRYAFYGCAKLSELLIPAQVEHIGSYAFLGTNDINLYLAADSMPAYLDEDWDRGVKGYYVGVVSVDTIGDYKCATLNSGNIAIIEYLGDDTTVDLSSVDLGAPITAIGGSSFRESAVTSIILPDSLLEIHAEAFAYTGLQEIVIPANVTFIGREAFAHTDIRALTFAEGSQLSVLEQYAFAGAENLTSVMLPASLTTMGTGVFAESGLRYVTFAEGIAITEIPQQAFLNTYLSSVDLPDSVTLVKDNAFANIQTLKSVSFGSNNGIRLLSNAFYNTGLESLHIPANVTYIGEFCFVGLSNLKEFSIDDDNPNYSVTDGLLMNKSGRKLIAVPAGRTGSLTVPLSVEEIGFGAFEGSKLSEILFDEDANILTFGYRAFFGAENITEITIPASVVSIDYYAFAYCKKLQTVNFAEGCRLKGIYEGAFCGDSNLEEIVIPDCIVEISDFAFYGCSSLSKLPISERNNIKGIYDYAFAYSGISGEFTAPGSLNDIGNYAFMGTKITNLTIPDANSENLLIGIGAFEGCEQMEAITLPFIGASYEDEEITWFGYIFGAGDYKASETYIPKSLKSVEITDGITFVGIGGFAGGTGLETISVPHSVSVLYRDAFADVTANYTLTNIITTKDVDWRGRSFVCDATRGHFGDGGLYGELTLSDDVTSVGSNAFEDCSNLTKVVLGKGINGIGSCAFEDCVNLESILIPDGVTGEIGGSAFLNCSGLENMVIPGSIEGIGGGAFQNCSNLRSLVIKEGVEWLDEGVYSRDDIGRISLFRNCSSLESIVIPDSVISGIASEAFWGCDSLESVKIGDGVTYIDEKAFYQLENLTEVIIGDSVVSIGDYAFYKCSNLSDLVIGSSVATIDEHAFYECNALETITIPDSVTEIATYAFSQCSNVEILRLGAGVASIGINAFSGCTRLHTVYYGGDYVALGLTNGMILKCVDKNGNVSYLYENCFETEDGFVFELYEGSYRLIGYVGAEDTVTLPDNINGSSYEIYSFAGGRNVIIPEGITSIENSMFAGNNTIETLVVPDGVTLIGDSAFSGCSALTEVVLPDSVTGIGDSAFRFCSKLAELRLPSGLQSIGARTFEYCNSLESIVIPDGVTCIGGSAFSGCSALEEIDLPNSLEHIDGYAFQYCISLESIVIPDSVTGIDGYAFDGCNSLKNVNLPDGITTIAQYTFNGCRSLETVSIPDSVTSIGTSAFHSNTEILISAENPCFRKVGEILYDADLTTILHVKSSISGRVEIMEGITAIPNGAFSDCVNITEVAIPCSVTSIGNKAFMGCTGLINIEMPTSVASIGEYAFMNCASLPAIIIPNGVKSIGAYALSGCTSLKSVEIPPSLTSIGWYLFMHSEGVERVYISDIEAWCTNGSHMSCLDGCSYELYLNGELVTDLVIPDSVTAIRTGAFAGCSSLTSVVVPEGVTAIGNRTFSGCSNLTSVVIPDSVTSIDYHAFNNCVLLAEVELPDALTYIGDSAFSDCDSLTSVAIPGRTATIGMNAFSRCDNLTSVIIPDSVTTIDYYAFSSCNNLEYLRLGTGVTTVRNGAFSECGNLAFIDNNSSLVLTPGASSYGGIAKNALRIVNADGSIVYGLENCYETEDGFLYTLEDGVCKVRYYLGKDDTITLPMTVDGYEYTLYKFGGASHIIMPGTMTSIPDNMFYACKAEYIEIPDSVTSIGGSAFYSCGNLKGINISGGVTSIGEKAFWGCSALTEIVIPDSVTDIGSFAFSYCRGLTSIVIPDSVTNIGRSVFSYCRGLTSIVLPDSVTSIGYEAFENCCSLTTIVLPDNVESIGDYAFAGCSSLQSINIPDGVTQIGSKTFSGCTTLPEILIPDSVTYIGWQAFSGCTSLTDVFGMDGVTYIEIEAFSNCPVVENYSRNGMCVLNTVLYDVDEDLEYLSNTDGIQSITSGAYENCHRLKNAIWCSEALTLSNVETIIVNNLTGKMGTTTTLKNVVLTDEISIWDMYSNPGFFSEVTDITIFVEANEKDLRWDDNFPGWNNGNRVIYGDKWSWSNFWDAEGNLALSEPRRNSQVIVRPVVNAPAPEGDIAYEFVGWDADGDGVVDELPATSPVDINAEPVFVQVPRTHVIRFVDRDGTVHQSLKLAYGTAVVAPEVSARKGYDFLGWEDYSDGLIADRDMVFTAIWQHHGTGHEWSVPAIVEPTCTQEGYTVTSCPICDEEIRSDYTNALGHTWGAADVVTDATCTEDGYASHSCTACGETETVMIPALGHDFTVTVVKEPTCSMEGERLCVCENCGETTHEAIATIEHSYQKKYAAKWWLEWLIEHLLNIFFGYEGNQAYYYECVDCGHIRTEDELRFSGTSAMDVCSHILEDWAILCEPSCEGQGTEGRICSVCSNVITARVYAGALEHDLGVWTNLDDAHHARACQRDGCAMSETEEHGFTYEIADYTLYHLCDKCDLKKEGCSVSVENGAISVRLMYELRPTWICVATYNEEGKMIGLQIQEAASEYTEFDLATSEDAAYVTAFFVDENYIPWLKQKQIAIP